MKRLLKVNRKRWLLVLSMLLLAAMLLSACSSSDTPTQQNNETSNSTVDNNEPQATDNNESENSAQKPKELKEINIGYMPDMHGATPLVIAQEKGYFEEQGLKPNFIKFLNGPQELQAMASGDLDVGYIGPGAVFLAAQGQAKILMPDSLNTGDMVLTSVKTGIKTGADLKGKKVGVPKGTSGEMVLNLLLKKYNLKPSDVNIINIDVAGAVAAFTAGKVDAVAIWSPYTAEIEKQLGKENIVALATNKDFMPEYTFPQSWVANPNVLEKDEDLVIRFIKAWNKANDYRIANLDEAVKLTADFTQVPEDSLKVQLDTTEWLKSTDIKAKYEDGSIYSWYENLEKLFVETGKMTEVVDPKEFVVGDVYLKSLSQ